jgi:HEAT repeat protein
MICQKIYATNLKMFYLRQNVRLKVMALLICVALTNGCGKEPQEKLKDVVNEKRNIINASEKAILSNIQNKSALSQLLSALKDESFLIRSDAAVALGVIGEKYPKELSDEVVPALAKAMKDSHPAVRREVAHSLLNYSSYAEAAIPSLVEGLKEGNRDVAWFSAEALGKMGPRAKAAIPGLIEALKTRSASGGANASRLPMVAADALGQMGKEASQALPALIAILGETPKAELTRDEADFFIEVAAAVLRIEPGNILASQRLAEILKNERVWVRWDVIEALRKVGRNVNQKVIKPALTIALNDEGEDVRNAARDLLKQLGDRSEHE